MAYATNTTAPSEVYKRLAERFGRVSIITPRNTEPSLGVDIITDKIVEYSIRVDDMEFILAEYYGTRNYPSTSGANSRQMKVLKFCRDEDEHELPFDEKTLNELVRTLQ